VIEGRTGAWETVVGLEVHAQVTSEAKLFSGAATGFGAGPNTQVSPIDAGMPGMLPVLNQACVEQAVRTGLALDARINLTSVFERKNYFYPDLPAGYQISQYVQPVVGEGTISLDLDDGTTRVIGIERLHLEQDAGKSLHDRHPSKTYVDLNRSGVALMEIVSKPDLRSSAEAAAYLTKLRSILRYLGSCDGNMEQGSMRCDVNVSVRRPGAPLGTRTEVKNVNSIRFVRQSIDYEAARQVELIEAGGEVVQETLQFDPERGVTRPMRIKEDAHDYRYFPDPDLVPLRLDQDWVDRLAAELPELPDAKKQRFIADYGLSVTDAGRLVAEREIAVYYEALAAGRDPKTAANWVLGELFAALNRAELEIAASPVSAARLGGLIELITDATISGRVAKEVFAEMFASGQAAAEIVDQKGLRQVTDTAAIEAVVDRIVADNPDQVAKYRAGNAKLIGWFVGRVMQATEGKANPKAANEILRKKLGA
jgi:aspartyl-tRNA(Asn)/glutamyl-tRNA(Gln) amidotransferase subunit B